MAKELFWKINKFQRADSTRIPVRENDEDFCAEPFFDDIPTRVVDVLGVAEAKLFLWFQCADNLPCFEIHDVNRSRGLVGAIQAGSKGVVAPNINIADGAAGG